MRTQSSALIATLVLAICPTVRATGADVRHIRPDRPNGHSAAVVVDADLALVHTAQLFSMDEQGKPIGAGRPGEQVKAVFDRLETALRRAGSGLDRVVKLNVVLARPDLLPLVREALAARNPGRDGPALSIVVGELARPGALLAIDAVALTGSKPPAGDVDRTFVPGFAGQTTGATLAVLPAGPRVYISGQAEPGPDLATATRKTLESLEATLKHLGLGKEHVVQVKAFFLPMKSADVVEREVAAFFGAPGSPPLVLVDWRMSQPIEIELIASAPAAGGEEAVEYLATPALKPSPVFSRVARVNRGDLVYVSGLFGTDGATGTAQVEAIFDDLKGILSESGSDLRHMAKATYYVSDEDASKALNDLRPKYYDPARPPAASKATVPGVALDGRTVTLDMIAVVPGKPGTGP